MRVGIPLETAGHERRVALVPDGVVRVIKTGVTVAVQRGAGARASMIDADFSKAGATLVDSAASLFGDSQVVAKVQPPTVEEIGWMAPGTVLISLLPVMSSAAQIAALNSRRITALALEQVPRITRAQSMDVLSSQSTVSGYKATLLGASLLGKFLPMLTTAAGSIPPARVFVLGAGVAGLQAIATARRLGAIVSAFDVRAAAREQVQSLGASFVAAELATPGAEGAGGYATELAEEQHRRELEVIHAHLKEVDLVITTALIPNRPAPLLITAEMVRDMRPGSVIIDLACEQGGNCALTRAGETIVANGVTIVGPANLPSSVAVHASQMLSKNITTLLQHLVKDGEVRIDLADEITAAMVVTYDGQQRTPGGGR
jgi:NAD(P) transhydrogenase subunit alpha